MSTNLRPFASIALIAASCFWACEPDLGALSNKYDPNASGAGGTKQEGGGTGGVSGTNPTGGTGGTSVSGNGGTGGDVPIGGSGDEAGAAGESPTGGTGGTSGTSGTGGGTAGTGGSGTTSACSNKKRDSNESDVDCGGTSVCSRCDAGLRCTTNGDCDSAFCSKGHCTEPTCADMVKNQGETGTDCGGPCSPCADDVGCNTNDDCIGQYCKDSICTDHCLSGVKDADETDKDCGGKDCDPCGTGKHCLTEKDCAGFVCNNNKCVAPTCTDSVANQGEGDVDCGAVCADQGKWCTAVAHNSCNLANDCDTSVCTGGHCAADTAAATIDPVDVISNFEDSSMLLPTTGGRAGNWYGYDDMTTGALHTTGPEAIPGHRGANSAVAIHTSGSGFTNWGAGIGADLNNGSSGKKAYNASFLESDGTTMTPYAGITFWARSDTSPQAVSVVFPDGDTDSAGGLCTTCDHHYLSSIIVGSDWQRFTVLFSSLQLESGTSPQPGPFDPTRLVSVQFRVNPGPPFDYWVDDVAFVRP